MIETRRLKNVVIFIQTILNIDISIANLLEGKERKKRISPVGNIEAEVYNKK